VDIEFIDTYGAIGYMLRNLDINTSSRIAMLSSLVHLQKNNPVPFEKFYSFSLDQTGEKLEKSSFQTLLGKLDKALDTEELVLQQDEGFLCTSSLLSKVTAAKHDLDNLSKHLG